MSSLDELEKKIQGARRADPEARQEARAETDGISGKDLGMAVRLPLEMGVSVGVSCCVGYLLDTLFGTAPLFLIVFIFLGILAGFVNMYRAANGLGYAVGYSQLHKKEKQGKGVPETGNDRGSSS